MIITEELGTITEDLGVITEELGQTSGFMLKSAGEAGHAELNKFNPPGGEAELNTISPQKLDDSLGTGDFMKKVHSGSCVH